MNCPICGGAPGPSLLTLPDMPVFCNRLWPSRRQALGAARGAIELHLCGTCGFVFNGRFDPARVCYSQGYENSLHFSPHFQAYARRLAGRLTRRYALAGKTVVEVGCGSGEFLRLLCQAGCRRGVGFDPSAPPGAEGPVQIRNELLDAAACPPAGLLCSRHVLEHIAQPLEFLRDLRRAIGRRRMALYLEVPNALYMLRTCGIWDVIYEHPSYFTPASLEVALRRTGFDVLALRPSYGGQFLGVEARPGRPRPHACLGVVARARLERLGEQFSAAAADKISRWKATIARMGRRPGQGVVLWGAGSKGVTFLNLLGGGSVRCAVDLNPRKHDRFVAGVGKRVVGPESLKAMQPDGIIVMNPAYTEEIRRIASGLDIRCPLWIA